MTFYFMMVGIFLATTILRPRHHALWFGPGPIEVRAAK